MDSSETVVMPDVHEISIDELTPIDSLETCNSYSSAMKKLRQSTTELPTTERKNSESKWKPLIGTPSKSPIPDNILVPDPSPTRTVSDTASTIMPAPSTPGSFVHQRRQGEYVPRPPVWTIYNLDGTGSLSTSSSPPSPMDLADDESEEELPLEYKRAPMLKHVNRKPSTHNLKLSDLKLQDVFFNNQLMKMGEVFMDRPLVVNMVQITEPQTLSLPNSQRLPSGTETSSLGTEAGSRNGSNPMPPSDHIPPAEVTGDPGERRDGSSEPNAEPTQRGDVTENNTRHTNVISRVSSTDNDTPHHLEDLDATLNQPGPSALYDEINTVSDIRTTSNEQDYSLMEGPIRSIERLSYYVDMRFKLTPDQTNPLLNHMKVGSFITYVGRTHFPDSINGEACEFHLPRKSRYLIADIYGDYWALLIRLERGLELGEFQPSFLGRKLKARPPERTRCPQTPEAVPEIGLRTDPKYIIYAPLCAFTLTINEHIVEEPDSSDCSDSMNSHRGWAQAALRNYSNDAQAENVKDRFTFIPKAVYQQYVAHFDRSRARNDPATSLAENRNPSGRLRDFDLKSPVGTTKSVKNTPPQNFRDLFTRKKDPNVVSVSSTARFDDTPTLGGRASPNTVNDAGFVANRAPQIPPLPSSFQSLSLGSPDEPLDGPPRLDGPPDTPLSPPVDGPGDALPAYLDSPPQRDSSPLRVRDTNLRSIPLRPNDSAAISRKDEQQPPAKAAVPMERSNTRASSNPTPKPKNENPSANSPPQVLEREIIEESGSGR